MGKSLGVRDEIKDRFDSYLRQDQVYFDRDFDQTQYLEYLLDLSNKENKKT